MLTLRHRERRRDNRRRRMDCRSLVNVVEFKDVRATPFGERRRGR
jgi:hypothetical protein